MNEGMVHQRRGALTTAKCIIAALLLATIGLGFQWFASARRQAMTQAIDSAALGKLGEFHVTFVERRRICADDYIKELDGFVEGKSQDYELLNAYRRKVQSVKTAGPKEADQP